MRTWWQKKTAKGLLPLLLVGLAIAGLCGCSTFNATERCQVNQYVKAHPDILKHKLELDT